MMMMNRTLCVKSSYSHTRSILHRYRYRFRICKSRSQSSSLLYLTLRDVTVSGVPTNWGMFCGSNLRKLCLVNHPWRNRLTMVILHGILCNSKDTLETLELRWIIAVEEDSEWAQSSLPMNRVTLPRVEHLDIDTRTLKKPVKFSRLSIFPLYTNCCFKLKAANSTAAYSLM